MIDRTTFFARIRATLFDGKLNQPQVDGINAILDEAAKRGLPPAMTAYLLATPHHETGRSFLAIDENLNYTTAARIVAVFGKYLPTVAAAAPYVRQPEKLGNLVYANRMGNGPPESGDGYRYHGRGPSQLTGKDNYRKAGSVVGLDLVTTPALALDIRTGIAIMFAAMLDGWFTGKKLADYIKPGAPPDFVNARRVVNGTDRAADVAGYAQLYLNALSAAGAGDPYPASTVVPPAAPIAAAPVALPSNAAPAVGGGAAAIGAAVAGTSGGHGAALWIGIAILAIGIAVGVTAWLRARKR